MWQHSALALTFSLYSLAVWRFDFQIKTQKQKPTSQPPDAPHLIGQQAREAYDKLVTMAAAGNKAATGELEWLHEICWIEIKKNIRQKAMRGELSDRLPPIGTLLEMADFAAMLLVRLPALQNENLKKYARRRWQWPGLIHLCKREQNKYVKFAKKIELGKNLDLNINPSRTNGDYLFTLAAHAIFCVTIFEPDPETKIPHDLRWMRGHSDRFLKIEAAKFQTEAESHLRSLGKFSRQNFQAWRPAFETFLTMSHGPFKERLKRLQIVWPDELIMALKNRTERQWLENYRNSHPMTKRKYARFAQFVSDVRWRFLSNHLIETPAFDSDFPEIQEVVSRRKTERGNWNELKDEIVKRICKLAPPS